MLFNNGAGDDHLAAITENLKKCDRAYFAVAFLKCSGLKKLLSSLELFLNKNGILTIVAGQNYALTEPKALFKLYELFSRNKTSKLYLFKLGSGKEIFHPKLYLFESKSGCKIIAGSANFTNGGLSSNLEASIDISCGINDQIWNNACGFFTKLIAKGQVEEASIFTIKQYEKFFNDQRTHNQKTKAAPVVDPAQLPFNYHDLILRLKKLDQKELQTRFIERLRDYKKARKVLNEIADTTHLTKNHFVNLLDQLILPKGLWHSGSMYRHKESVYKHHSQFQELVRFIRNNINSSVSDVYNEAKKKVDMINGASVNYITEIMITYDADRYAVLNNNPLTVLRSEAGLYMKAAVSSFKGDDYADYCNLITEIRSKLKLKNMLEADSFFNEIYWSMKK